MVVTRIRNLEVEAVIGVHDYERKARQPLNIDIELEYDIAQAVENDDVNYVVDYEQICQLIIEKVKHSRFRLIETLADYILHIIWEDFRIQRGVVRIAKPNAVPNAKSVEVEVGKSRW